jgi:hypothetical protein
MDLQTVQQLLSLYTLLPAFLILGLVSFPPDMIFFTTYCCAFAVCPVCFGDVQVVLRSPIYHICWFFNTCFELKFAGSVDNTWFLWPLSSSYVRFSTDYCQ